MLSVFTALFLYTAASSEPSVSPTMNAGLRYVDPQYVVPAVPARAVPHTMTATRVPRSDGEIQMRLEGFRMETRAVLDQHGQLQIICGLPGHPSTAHSHSPAEQTP